jgi:RND family efflux transporter MFP subunit
LRQSKSDLATAAANARIATSTDVRWKGLLVNKAVSPQDAETRAASAEAAQATAASAQANVGRLEELESFKRVVAPFDGVVTARNTDIGALINAGQSTGSQLFRVSDVTRLRVYVQVPEQYAPQTLPGVAAQLRFNEHPGVEYPAKVVRTAQALDPTLRTLQVELQVDNSKGELFPGAYAEVHFKLPGNAKTLRVPATALVFRAAGLQIATVVQGNQVKLHSVSQGRDFGTTVELLTGVTANDVIIVNPPDSITDGARVRIAKPPPPHQQTPGKE